MLGRKPKVPQPVSTVLAVLDDVWLPYGLNRDSGLDPDDALQAALAAVLVGPPLDQVVAFMRGDLDPEYHLSGEQAGPSFRRDMVEQAEVIYRKLRELPDWPR
ncbi:MAG: hypothetical protein M3N98_03310 [Actinomycetota bacterium]|nr:hypothetical protein [Actinomycetota bacterium]